MAPPKKKGKLSRSAKFYRKSKKARAKKKKTDTKINRRPEQRRKRSEAGKARRKAKKQGRKVTGLDYDHATGRFVDSSKNRGRRGEGGRKKKK
jgi:hypothetical protein